MRIFVIFSEPKFLKRKSLPSSVHGIASEWTGFHCFPFTEFYPTSFSVLISLAYHTHKFSTIIKAFLVSTCMQIYVLLYIEYDIVVALNWKVISSDVV